MTFCQNRDLISKNDHTYDFFCDDILQGQARVRDAKIAWCKSFKNETFGQVMLAELTSKKWFGPAGGRSLRASVSLW